MKKEKILKTTNDCLIRKATEKDFPFSTEIIYMDENNRIGIEFNWDIRIRIDGVTATDYESFSKMMDFLLEIARENGYDQIVFAEHIENDIAEMFLRYGFNENFPMSSKYNRFFELSF